MAYKRNKKRHIPPSRIRYEERNPVFSVRMPLQWHNELKTLMENAGLSKKDFLASALNRQTLNYEHLRERLINEGIEEGKTMCSVKMYCYGCRTQWLVLLNPPTRKTILDFSERTPLFYCDKCKKEYGL
jgi:hypothetical protein